jgi:hypothetical protein
LWDRFIGSIREASLEMDNVNILSEDEKDIVVADKVCRAFQEAFGLILNKNCKTVVLGLGSWKGYQAWLPPMPQAVEQAMCMRL